MKSIEEKIAVMQACADGKQIQIKLKSGNKWEDCIQEEPQWDWTLFDYRVKPERYLPTTWEEFCETHPIKRGEAYINMSSNISTYDEYDECDEYKRDVDEDKNLLPNRRYAKAMLALGQLIQLRDCYNEGWQPNWEDEYSAKYCIIFDRNDITPMSRCTNAQVLTFKTEELRDEFIKNFKELIKIAKPLI